MKRVGGEEVELIAALNGERVENDVTLASLIAFDSVDTDFFQFGNAELLNLLSNHCNLIAIGDNDTDRLLRLKVIAELTMQTSEQVGDDACLFRVNLL